jgi:pilus assembly protein Flp/PilA
MMPTPIKIVGFVDNVCFFQSWPLTTEIGDDLKQPTERRTIMKEMIKRFLKDEEGATMVEYGIMVALIAAICILVITTLGTQIQAAFQAVVDAL